MFQAIPAPKGDPILSLITAYNQDPRTSKIDLGIGVYKDDHGITPVMEAVTLAEQKLLQANGSKSYQGLTGDEQFNESIANLLLSGTKALECSATLQTPGASGALRMLADLIAVTAPNATVWISNPSYVNHRPIMEKAGLAVREYTYLDPQTKAVDEEAMLAQIAQLGANDVVLLHGCCHNPSGADMSFAAWQKIAELANNNGFLPFIDIAYQGLGDGLEEDAKGLQYIANNVEEFVISTSCSKNFGLYRERTGAAIIVSQSKTAAMNSRGKMCELARGSYSMPPAHGAAIVDTILRDDQLNQIWRNELTAMNVRVNGLRSALVEEFRAATQSNRFDYFGAHKGMFSLTGISDEHIAQLKDQFGIYIVGGGRINVAGLNSSQVKPLVAAFVTIGA
ncbi:aromatic amino acid transaminase [Reinekea sp.]|jgi:aspartate aminotransferase|uniref:amino acid aminotransferase n=1 Tax=Reinekea sp. TaxID=1970455 RepID=UPI0039892CE8